jgi:hypothetical protein
VFSPIGKTWTGPDDAVFTALKSGSSSGPGALMYVIPILIVIAAIIYQLNPQLFS